MKQGPRSPSFHPVELTTPVECILITDGIAPYIILDVSDPEGNRIHHTSQYGTTNLSSTFYVDILDTDASDHRLIRVTVTGTKRY